MYHLIKDDSSQVEKRYKLTDEIFIDYGLEYAQFITYLPLSKFDLKDVDLIKYGYDMIEIVSLHSNLFSIVVEYNHIEKTTVRYISFTDSGKECIIDFLSDDIHTFPMITPPVDWDIDILDDKGDYKITSYGGYMSNKVDQQSFIHKNYKNVGSNRFKDKTLIKALNALQKVEFKVNSAVLDVLIKQLNENRLLDLLPVRFHDLTTKTDELRQKKEFGTLKSIYKHNSIVFNNINIITNALLLRKMGGIYFPMFVD